MNWIKSLMLIGAVVSVSSCGKSKKTRSPLPVKVTTMLVESSKQTSERNYVGAIEENKSVALSFSTGGTLQSILVNEGEIVSKGSIVAKLNDVSAHNAYEAARSAFQQAEDGYKRVKQLYERQSIPEVRLVEMESKLQQARSSFEISKKNLEDCVLKAPFSGVIGRKYVETGENILPGVTVITLLDIQNVKAQISVPENEISLLAERNSSLIRVPALGDEVFKGSNIEKQSAGDALTHTYGAWVNIENKDKRLLPGMVCNVTITLEGDDLKDEIMLPMRVVQESSRGEKFVWKVVGENATRCPITTGEIIGNNIVVTSGLSIGDKLVKEGYQKIGEGTKIIE